MRLRDFFNICQEFNHRLNNLTFECLSKSTFNLASFNHVSPHFSCFIINRISKCTERLIPYTLTVHSVVMI